MAPNISIIDFDLTITKQHTFATHQMRDGDTTTFDERFQQGVVDAQTNLKEGLQESSLFNFDDEGMFANATHHNNPDYVAGYLSVILGESITPVSDTKNGNVAIKQYSVAGRDKPLLISYIPKIGNDFAVARSQLNGKNEQIVLLKNTLETAGLADKSTIIHFYDDDTTNLREATWIDDVVTHHINAENSQFTVIGEKQPPIKRKPVATLESATRLLIDTGLVYPATHSRQETEEIMKRTGCMVLRESSSLPGQLVMSYPDPENTSKFRHELINDLITSNLAEFVESNAGMSFLETRYRHTIHDHAALQKGIKWLESTHLVYPATLTRQEAERILTEEGTMILRQSSSIHGELVISYPDPKNRGSFRHELINIFIERNSKKFTNPVDAIAYLEDTYKHTLINPSAKAAASIETTQALADNKEKEIHDIKNPLAGIKQETTLESALENLRSTGLVYPNTFTRKETEDHLAVTGGIILRESTSLPGQIVLSHRKDDQSYEHILLQAHIEANLDRFSTAQDAIKHLENTMKKTIDGPEKPSIALK